MTSKFLCLPRSLASFSVLRDFKMSGQVDCLEDYLSLISLLSKCRAILSLSFIPLKTIQKYGKFLVLGFATSITISNAGSAMKPKNLYNFFINIIILFALLQLMSKLHAIMVHHRDLNNILMWIKSLHTVRHDTLKRPTEFHLRKTIQIVKYISR